MSSDSDEAAAATAPRHKPSAFAAAAMLDDSDDDSVSSEEGGKSAARSAATEEAAVSAAAVRSASSSKAAAPPAAKSKGKDGKKGGAKGGKGAAADEEDDWALLDELSKKGGGGGAPAAAGKAAPAPVAVAAASASAADAAADILARLGVGAEEPSAKASKKKKKKGGKAAPGEEGEGEEGGAAPVAAPAAAAPAAAAPGKLARAALERQAAMRAEAERRATEEAERARIEAEEAALEAAEEKRRTDEKERKKAKARAKKEQELRDGVYMSEKQKAALLAARARLGLPASGAGTDAVVPAAAAAAVVSPTNGADASGSVASGDSPVGAVLQPQKKGAKAASLYAKKRPAAAATGAGAGEAEPAAVAEKPAAAAPEPAPVPAPSAPLLLPPVAADWEEAVEDWETAADTSVAPSPPGSAAAATSTSSAAAHAPSSSSSSSSSSASSPAAAAAPPSSGPSSSTVLTRAQRMAASLEARSPDRLRSPICVVLGHVDTGKTSLLDKIRRTNVQEGEAGGITQQIGATYFPMDRLAGATDKVNKDLNLEYRIPGLLIIDTPGHEQFTNLRSRGSSLCDIAVLVVDITAGLERQTIESLNLLRQKRTPFVVALNKVDRMYGWKPMPGAPIRESLRNQPDFAVSEFETRTQRVLTQIAEQGLNAALYYENDNFKKIVSVVPTSAHTGEGIPDLLMLIVQLTQQMMAARLMYQPFVQATILEVKTIDGLGTTVDVVLVNGELREGDTIVVCGMEGPIVTQIRALLTPPPLREMRVKGEYIHHKRIEAAMGVKISAQGLEKAVAGTSLLVAEPEDDIEELKEEVIAEYDAVMKGFKRESQGVYVMASTLGSLEALLEYLHSHDPPIPVSGVALGPVHKKDVVTSSIMLEHRKEYAVILAFDVKVTVEAREAADKLGVKIFTADIIYHLSTALENHIKSTTAAKQAASVEDAVFPVIARINPLFVFNARDPIVVGVDVLEGRLKVGTKLCVVLEAGTNIAAAKSASLTDGGGAVIKSGPLLLDIGRVAGIEHNHTQQTEAAAGGPPVAVKIVPAEGASAVQYGRHFDHTQLLYAHISRESINVLKENFRSQMKEADWKTIIKLKGLLGVD